MPSGDGRDTNRAEVVRWWTLLGHDLGELVDARTLAGGASGSAVYRLIVDRSGGASRELVLKVASDQTNRERAHREWAFYRELASGVPVLVPTLVAGTEQQNSVCLLFEAAGTATSPTQWPRDRWEDLAAELGGLHRTWGAEMAARLPWPKVGHPVAAEEITSVSQTWAKLGYTFLLAPVWSTFDSLEAALAELPICLRHGDWHLGNILTDPSDRFVWIDWQEVGPGHGPEDLALLWQRAECDGLTPPREAMLTAYARSRGIPDDSVLHRAAVAAELVLLLLSWPPYLAIAPEAARARLLRRLEHLVSVWQE